jgi:hypothetical protein
MRPLSRDRYPTDRPPFGGGCDDHRPNLIGEIVLDWDRNLRKIWRRPDPITILDGLFEQNRECHSDLPPVENQSPVPGQ